MTTTLNNSYLIKVSTWGGGGQYCPKFFPRGLYTPKPAHTPIWQTLQFISFSESVSHLVRLVYLGCELTYLSYFLKLKLLK